MAGVGTGDISFSGLRTAWGDASYAGGSDPGATNISLSEFYGATFTDGTSAPSSGEISIGDFTGKTFGSQASGTVYTTDGFRAYDNWSSHSTSLRGVGGSSVYTGLTTANKRIRLYGGTSLQTVDYPILLLTPNASSSTTSPGIIVDRSNPNVVDEATVWIRAVAHGSEGGGTYPDPWRVVQMGIIAKDMTIDNWTTQKSNLTNKHATYMDRLGFHGYGYHNYAGSRDDITSSSTIVSPQYKSGTYGAGLSTTFHTRTGRTAGTQRSFNAGSVPYGFSSTAAYFFTSAAGPTWYVGYPDYRGSTKFPNHGFKIKWYETTIQCSLESGSNIIQPVSPPSTWSSSDLTDVFSGMYIYGTGINTDDGAFIGEIHTNYMKMYKQKGTSTNDLVSSNASLTQTNVTLTISGYLYWTLVTASDTTNSNTNYVNPKILGPPHQVLPKYQAASQTEPPSEEITEWAFYIGDTTSNKYNTFQYDIRNTEPGGTAFSYSVSYSSGTVPTGISTGLYLNSSAISSGNKGTSVQTITFDLSGSAYVGSSIIGETGRIVFKYVSGSGATGDMQIVQVTTNGSNSNVGVSYTSWQRNTLINEPDYPGQNDWSTIGTGLINGNWSRRTGGTTTGATGVSPSSIYGGVSLLFETTTPGYPNKTGFLRGPNTTFTSNSVTVRFYAYGATMGALYAGVEIT